MATDVGELESVVAGQGWFGVPEEVRGHPHLRRIGDHRIARPREQRLDRLVENSLEVLAEWMDRCAQPFISFSGGKDSTALYHLARRVDPDAHAIYVADEELGLPEIYEMVDWHVGQGCEMWCLTWGSWLDLYREHGADSPHVQGHFGDAIRERTTAHGYDGQACGYRADENLARWHLKYSRGEIYQLEDGRWAAAPMLDWTTDDVWAYLARYGLPYCRLYDLEDGLPREERRVDTIWGPDCFEYGRITRLKRFYPEYYRRFVAACPEIRRYT